MKDWKIGLTLVSIYMLLFGAVVAHLIFDMDITEVWIFCWLVDRLTVFAITLTLLVVSYAIELGLVALTIHVRNSRLRLVGVGISSILLIVGIFLLQFSLTTEFENRLVWFDSALMIIVAAWSIIFWLATRQWRRFA